MPTEAPANTSAPAGHGARQLTAVHVDTYNAELRDADGFVGDRASNRAFQAILEDVRDSASRLDEDPIGDIPSKQLSRKKLEELLLDGDPQAAGVLLGTIEEFAQEFASVIGRFLRLQEWRGTQRIVVGGGLRASRIGELAIGRAAVILKAAEHGVDLQPIRHDPDEAGLIGCIHLAPASIFTDRDSILAVDIGGSSIRVAASDQWHHADDKPGRDDAVARLVGILQRQIKRAQEQGLRLAPFIGIGCPGLIRKNGSIEKGGQNLPGDWESKSFNLPHGLRDALPKIGGHDVAVRMHNDAVVQGLSEAPFMREVRHWGVMTIGTGLGNARFTSRAMGPN